MVGIVGGLDAGVAATDTAAVPAAAPFMVEVPAASSAMLTSFAPSLFPSIAPSFPLPLLPLSSPLLPVDLFSSFPSLPPFFFFFPAMPLLFASSMSLLKLSFMLESNAELPLLIAKEAPLATTSAEASPASFRLRFKRSMWTAWEAVPVTMDLAFSSFFALSLLTISSASFLGLLGNSESHSELYRVMNSACLSFISFSDPPVGNPSARSISWSFFFFILWYTALGRFALRGCGAGDAEEEEMAVATGTTGSFIVTSDAGAVLAVCKAKEYSLFFSSPE
mmetsp:Transcript_31041/g.93110  ORF Transcript_31041/g.93110 Transcript_31041/m.93110 type:complete len:279 (+) Transcript_31041:381-1217(+)